jgi:predicted RNA-binding Zn-ribbon protein involved in translation (DUF1610 family)
MIQSTGMAVEQTASTSETCPSCGTVIDTTEAEPLSRVTCPSCGEKVRVQRSFNNFELVETLGIGGMGEAQVPWAQLSPQTQLAVSSSFIKPNTPDAADREWLSAVYALQTGQTAAGKQFAEAAAKAKPEYKNFLQPLLQAKPVGH